ncbi:HutD/Ves family protein [Kitasatospora azatica]|uniref:HutD/Ves family protein n=1 Tax=Kitasatospora azatica TaxID=58347 RepID=UPI00056C97B3|nr:HutD family protein [Kitasatospora azatica]
MPIDQLPAAERTAVPWRNGGGVTREVASADLWRVSLAEIATDGPFSVFPGLWRVLTVVAGPGVELTVADAPPVTVEPLRPFAFPGDAPTSARLLGGPVTALNLMTRQPDADLTLRTGGELVPTPGHPLLAVALDGYDALLVTHPSTVAAPAGPLAVITL